MPIKQSERQLANQIVAVIGDVVGSKRLNRIHREAVQAKLDQFLVELNDEYRVAILSKFVITTGDEFQVLFKSAEAVADLIWAMEASLPEVSVRLGIGLGVLHTPLKEFAIGMDGPAFHEARSAIDIAKRKRWLGGVFAGFGEAEDTILNGLARLLERQRSSMTESQREVANGLRSGLKQIDVAKKLGITRQAVHEHVNAMGWKTYEQGEAALRTALRRFGTAE
jgi:hypothetical protein